MKLLVCIKCNQVFNLDYEPQTCKGGHGGGQYLTSLKAKIWGDPKVIIPLGFHNTSFIDALRDHLRSLDTEIVLSRGTRFEAFVIPETATSIHRGGPDEQTTL